MNHSTYSCILQSYEPSFKRNLIQDSRGAHFADLCRFGPENDLLIVVVADQNHISCFSVRISVCVCVICIPFLEVTIKIPFDIEA